MKRAIMTLLALAPMLTSVENVNAGPILVTSYDIDNARSSGFGGWSNTYSGSITSNGDGTVQYLGGSGTLNDGILPTNASNSHLYFLSDNSVTHLHLAGGLHTINTLELYGFADGNSIPGDIRNVEVTINGISAVFTAVGLPPPNPSTGLNVNEFIDLTGSILEGLSTNAVAFRVLTTEGSGDTGYYQVGEAVVSGDVIAAVPEPATVTLLAIGIAGMAGYGWRKRKQAAA